MHKLIIAFLLLPLVGFADEVRIAVGMTRADAVALIKKHSAEDITSGQAILPPKGQSSPSGLYWAFRDYDAIIELVERDGKITEMTFWKSKDFGESKVHRAKTAQTITALKLDTKTREVSVEKKQANRVAGRIDLPAPTPPDMRVRVRRFLAVPKD